MISFLDSISDSPEEEPEDDDSLPSITLAKQSTSFIDLGCGNGSILLALRDEWAGPMLGIDYSPQSVALAKQVATSSDIQDPPTFQTWDILNGPLDQVGTQWDVVLDKGTFDAISLSAEKDARGRRLCEGYKERVLQIMKPGAIFLITSCNWTEQELQDWFAAESDPAAEEEASRLQVVGRVKYPSFSFGGVKGQTISTMCFKKL